MHFIVDFDERDIFGHDCVRDLGLIDGLHGRNFDFRLLAWRARDALVLVVHHDDLMLGRLRAYFKLNQARHQLCNIEPEPVLKLLRAR